MPTPMRRVTNVMWSQIAWPEGLHQEFESGRGQPPPAKYRGPLSVMAISTSTDPFVLEFFRTTLARLDFALSLKYSRLQSSGAPNDGTTDDKPDIYTALREQAGLKLVPDKMAIAMFVIDHIERPTEN